MNYLIGYVNSRIAAVSPLVELVARSENEFYIGIRKVLMETFRVIIQLSRMSLFMISSYLVVSQWVKTWREVVIIIIIIIYCQ